MERMKNLTKAKAMNGDGLEIKMLKKDFGTDVLYILFVYIY